MTAGIFFYGIVGAATVVLSCIRPNRKRYLAMGIFLLAAAAAGFFGAGIYSVIYYINMQAEGGTDTLYQLLFFSILAAVLLCLFVVAVSILSDRGHLIRPLTVLVPFLWAVFLQLIVWICASLTEDPGPILTLGISLCSLLLVCPGISLLRAAALLNRPDAMKPILAEKARRQKKKEEKKALQQKKQTLRSPRKRRETKSSGS